jgi:hypothetical protein
MNATPNATPATIITDTITPSTNVSMWTAADWARPLWTADMGGRRYNVFAAHQGVPDTDGHHMITRDDNWVIIPTGDFIVGFTALRNGAPYGPAFNQVPGAFGSIAEAAAAAIAFAAKKRPYVPTGRAARAAAARVLAAAPDVVIPAATPVPATAPRHGTKPVTITVTRDTAGGRWYTVVDTFGDEFTNHGTRAEAVQYAHMCAAEQGVTFTDPNAPAPEPTPPTPAAPAVPAASTVTDEDRAANVWWRGRAADDSTFIVRQSVGGEFVVRRTDAAGFIDQMPGGWRTVDEAASHGMEWIARVNAMHAAPAGIKPVTIRRVWIDSIGRHGFAVIDTLGSRYGRYDTRTAAMDAARRCAAAQGVACTDATPAPDADARIAELTDAVAARDAGIARLNVILRAAERISRSTTITGRHARAIVRDALTEMRNM